jgi:curved DNA-binding protein CbpA
MSTYYSILGVSEEASPDEIKAAFKRLAVRYHPDKNPDDPHSEELFKQVNEAYQVLSDAQQKFFYDQRLHAHRHRQSYAPYTSGGGSGAGPGYMRQSRARRERWRQGYAAGYAGVPPQYRHHNEAQRRQDDRKGIIIAFSLVGAVAVVIISMIGIHRYQIQRETDRMRGEHAAFMDYIRKHHDQDSIVRTLERVDRQLATTYHAALADFRDSLMAEVRGQAERRFKAREYEAARLYLGIMRANFPQDQNWIDPQLVECLVALKRYPEAEQVLRDLIGRKESLLYANMALGRLYREMYQSPEMALGYYNTAIAQIIRQYQEKYGNAYALMLDPANESEAQYEAFLAKAELCLALGDYAAAKAAATWASFLRPQRPQAHQCKASACMGLGSRGDACASWQAAAELGSGQAADSLRRYCR